MPRLASITTCTACAACIDVCPSSAISFKTHGDGHLYVDIDNSKCIECKKCERTCPIVSDYSYGSNDEVREAYAAWGNSTIETSNSASGGVFYELAKSHLASGGVVAGAIMDGLRCRYSLIDVEKDLHLIQGSKYTYTNPEGIYKSIIALLEHGKSVLFGGLPCHVAALIKSVPVSLKHRLTTVDLICGGVSSPILIDKYKELKDPGLKKIISFRDKTDGWKPNGFRYRLKTKDENGKIYVQPKGTKNLITDGFACALTNRYSCSDCKFAYLTRKSDMTIGDLWGDTRFASHHHNGVSIIYPHSERGLGLVKSSDLTINKINPIDYLQRNKRMFVGRSIKSKLPERRYIKFLFNHLSYNPLLKIYGTDFKKKDLIVWFPLAAYRYLSFRLDSFLITNRARKIIDNLKRE